MIDSIRVAFTALRTRPTPTEGELSVIELQDAPGTFLALDRSGKEHLLLQVLPAAAAEPFELPVATLTVTTRVLDIGGSERQLLDVACLFDSVAEVFEHFVAAVLEELRAGVSTPAAALSRVLERWRQFLEPPAAPPGRSKLASLLGELLVLRDLATRNPGSALAAWVGPFRGRHDFRRGITAVEVKTTRAHTSRKITIHGEDQLEPPERGHLFLHLVRLEEVAGSGSSVADLVDELLSLGVHAEALFTALSSSGLAVRELAATGEVHFDVRERLTLPVDAGMPRIVPSSFVGGARPVGVIDVSYVIDLDHRLDAALGDSEYDGLLTSLAGGGA